MVLVLLAFPLAAFGGAYDWIVVPLLAGTVLLTFIVRPLPSQEHPVLDRALAAILSVVVLQLLPLPTPIMRFVSLTRVHVAENLRLAPGGWMSASVAPAQTLLAAGILAAAVLTFLCCRQLFQTHGVRDMCRGVAWMGLALSFVAILQRATSASVIYGFWIPRERGGFPFGPFVNRNHCATWLVMAIPLCFGYLMARFGAHGVTTRRHRLLRSFDSTTVWLATAGLTMTLALAVAMSRSGLGAFAVAGIVILLAGRSRFDRLRIAWIGALIAAGLLAWFAFADLPALVDRFSEGIASGRPGRLQIWRDTLRVVRDFWLMGTGLGSYEVAMLFYQSGSRAYYFNHAHNHFLQLLAEGGVLMSLAVAIALVAFVRAGAAAIRRDGSRIFWIRVGAAAGLAAAAAQSLWETGLRMPANAELGAVLAALVVHHPHMGDERSSHHLGVWDSPLLMNDDGTPRGTGSARFAGFR